MGKPKKGRQLKAERESEIIEDFINAHIDHIIEYGAKRLRMDTASLTEADRQTVLDSFRETYKDYKYDKQYLHKDLHLDWTIKDTKESLMKSYRSDLFNTEEMRDLQGLIDNLKKAGEWELFRQLNRHQKIEMSRLVRLPPSSDANIRAQWLYTGSGNIRIRITLYYLGDGSSFWSLCRVTAR